MRFMPLLMACVASLISGSNAVLADEVIPTDESALQQALDRAGANREELERALKDAPAVEQEGMRFLIENMPDRDLKSLTADFLLENSRLTWQAVQECKWGASLPKDVIFDALLPYANINERRDRWRLDFYNRFKSIVADAATPSEAAALLNQKVFPSIKVKYSTGRKKADQSPFESMESGLASCTGLSVLLVDACRAVGVPARIVGTPLWSDKSGNHTWVEIWDNGWHFTGACEPTGKDVDKGWFTERASRAQRDHQMHAIYAVTFKRNGQRFPMVWAREVHDVYAVNVTDRYTAVASPLPEGHAVVRIRVCDGQGRRISVPVEVHNSKNELLFSGTSNDERFDANDHLTTSAATGTTLTVSVSENRASANVSVKASETLVDLVVVPPVAPDSQ